MNLNPVSELLAACAERAAASVDADAEIEDCLSFPNPGDLSVTAPRWKRIFDVVAVMADMKNSTALSFREHPKTSAKVYEAVTGNMVRIFGRYGPDFVDIQGDGVFALFHGEMAEERSLCAAISMVTFSRRHLDPLLKVALPDGVPRIGIKVGMAEGTLTAKRVGIRGTEEPVWAGRPVNWAAKCAEAADAHELVVTEGVWDHFKLNDWVRWSCGCVDGVRGRGVGLLWSGKIVPALANESCHALESYWCPNCGDDFHQAILQGETVRPDIGGYRG